MIGTGFLKRITFCGQEATVVCDGNCSKAWGINSRPRIQGPGHLPVYMTDTELPDAQIDPGTYEGGDAKPVAAASGADMNRWCVRECERSAITKPGAPDDLPDLPRFTERQRTARGG